jgi:AraC-like DNA-binding protein
MSTPITYREYAPASGLAALVRCYWTVAGNATAESTRTNRVLPDGCIDVIVNLSEPNAYAFVVGPMLEAEVFRHAGAVDMIGVRFVPGAASTFLRLPAYELTANTIAAGDIWPDIPVLIERLCEAANIERRLNVLNRYLLAKLEGGQRSDVALEAMQLIQRSRGLLSLSSLRDTLGVGERTLQRAFDGAVGLSPKQALRIMRFRHAVALLHRRPALTLARIALLTGYADQAHFTREFRTLAGVTPGYYGQEQALVGFVQDPIDTDAYIRAELA